MEEAKEVQLQVGDDAPFFSLPSEEGEKSLNDYLGSWLVLYFYPRDFTSGCTVEACDFRDALANDAMDAFVVGVSPDDVESHRKFREEHNLNFPLLADADHRVSQSYGAWGNRGVFGTGVKRSTFIIDPVGKVAGVYYNVRTQGHAQQVAADLKGLQENF